MRARLDTVNGAAQTPSRGDQDLNGAAAPSGRALAPAAVLAPLVVRDGALNVIFTVRAAHLTKHAGQISFPGGRQDPGDRRLADTARREALEEIGLPPEAVELVGSFDAYETVTGFAVTPFVGFVDPAFVPEPDPGEVEEVFEAPFAHFMDPANHGRGAREWRGVTRYFYEMPWGDYYVWGATAGMLKSLHDRLYAAR